ncbi:MAG: IS21 family transposase [Candidatus Eisenbacteria bacterium]|nr:IS21 family transposase [Candidatus Eisenbacteria bacterium]
MSNTRLSMRKVREVLRLTHEVKLPYREVAVSAGVSVGVVSKIVNRAKKAGLAWAEVSGLDEATLEVRLNGPVVEAGAQRDEPDPIWIHVEKMKPGVTLELLHIEYIEGHPNGLRYTAFCERYRAWLARRKLTMRQSHKAGERAFVDYSGKRPWIVDRKTGERQPVELFVGVLGASNFTFAEATRTQQSVDFIQSHVRMLEYFEGAPALIVPDNLKSGVTTASWYDPEVQRTYEELAAHYSTAVLPARPKKPRDKAKVEVAVQVVQRWILGRIRNEVFFTLDALNERIRELLELLNDRPMRAYRKSRRELYVLLDKPALKPLPVERFVYSEWGTARLNIDYHATFDENFYSAPYGLVHEHLDVRATALTVELYFKAQRVGSHVRSYAKGKYVTTTAHMPKAHQEHLEWPPSRVIDWAGKIGPHVKALIEALLAERKHPEQGYRPSLGIIRLAKTYGNERVDKACKRAHMAGARNYRHVAAILKNHLDDAPMPDAVDDNRPRVDHENIRGPGYYN